MATSAARPWGPWLVLAVGVLGGPVAAAAIAWMNACRLGVERRRRRSIVVLGAGAALFAAAAVAALTGDTWWGFGDASAAEVRYARLVPAAVGALLALGYQRMLASAYHDHRRHPAGTGQGQRYSSPWAAGLGACLFGFGIHLILVIAAGALVPSWRE